MHTPDAKLYLNYPPYHLEENKLGLGGGERGGSGWGYVSGIFREIPEIFREIFGISGTDHVSIY